MLAMPWRVCGSCAAPVLLGWAVRGNIHFCCTFSAAVAPGDAVQVWAPFGLKTNGRTRLVNDTPPPCDWCRLRRFTLAPCARPLIQLSTGMLGISIPSRKWVPCMAQAGLSHSQAGLGGPCLQQQQGTPIQMANFPLSVIPIHRRDQSSCACCTTCTAYVATYLSSVDSHQHGRPCLVHAANPATGTSSGDAHTCRNAWPLAHIHQP